MNSIIKPYHISKAQKHFDKAYKHFDKALKLAKTDYAKELFKSQLLDLSKKG